MCLSYSRVLRRRVLFIHACLLRMFVHAFGVSRMRPRFRVLFYDTYFTPRTSMTREERKGCLGGSATQLLGGYQNYERKYEFIDRKCAYSFPASTRLGYG